ncbi:sugar phosphate isomerase/epimerase [Cryobacterium sp. TMS1-13-1]|uniref:sugar phosphate isomerase/epimerase family protein n=1 Tax=Cryobacterium sp. TMS1-13-1 TaxID=1259220 RepID=UPI00106D3D86|nr:sugar phosphate isomerase/epimerase [Cryobacterium sp. TMS1-13-1]TFD25680.1 sugar phosphate isomerase/epimerase [Cryobacterium sp. TMS1-13-1]
MTYSIQLYTVRKALDADLTGTIKRIADIGFQLVEPYNFVATADELGAALRENGLKAPSGHAPLLRADQDEIFAAAQKLGIETVIDPHVPEERWKTIEDIEATADLLNAAAIKGTEYGITVGYHNHWWEVETFPDGRTGLEVLADHLDPAVVLELDTYWAAVGGQDPVALLGRLGNRVRLIHIKDGPVNSDPSTQLAVGDGVLPIWDIVDAAKGLEVGVIELDDFHGEMLDAVTDSYRYLAAGRVAA